MPRRFFTSRAGKDDGRSSWRRESDAAAYRHQPARDIDEVKMMASLFSRDSFRLSFGILLREKMPIKRHLFIIACFRR